MPGNARRSVLRLTPPEGEAAGTQEKDPGKPIKNAGKVAAIPAILSFVARPE
jgi:hypothetical protein